MHKSCCGSRVRGVLLALVIFFALAPASAQLFPGVPSLTDILKNALTGTTQDAATQTMATTTTTIAAQASG
ncbi:MAG: hypothetical protein WC820_04240, partial [Spirochaetales bacterium]